jgi:hypothetical protein
VSRPSSSRSVMMMMMGAPLVAHVVGRAEYGDTTATMSVATGLVMTSASRRQEVASCAQCPPTVLLKTQREHQHTNSNVGQLMQGSQKQNMEDRRKLRNRLQSAYVMAHSTAWQ